MIRPAHMDDLSDLVAMGNDFMSTLQAPLPYDSAHVTRLMRSWIEREDCGLFVEDQRKGMILMTVAPTLWNPNLMAQEIFWWVAPDARENGVGKALLLEAEHWAREMGAVFIMMSTHGMEVVGEILIDIGYRHLETYYVKGF